MKFNFFIDRIASNSTNISGKLAPPEYNLTLLSAFVSVDVNGHLYTGWQSVWAVPNYQMPHTICLGLPHKVETGKILCKGVFNNQADRNKVMRHHLRNRVQ
uniref:Uncharacterized protein n=1 Tax=Sphaerodactylus townsendi TaxID=933632 RepID=A0ACB8GAX4_9SAUR